MAYIDMINMILKMLSHSKSPSTAWANLQNIPENINYFKDFFGAIKKLNLVPLRKLLFLVTI